MELKKVISLIVLGVCVVILLVCAIVKDNVRVREEPPITPEIVKETKQETVEKENLPEHEDGKARMSDVLVFWKNVERGTKIQVTGIEGDYYTALLEETPILISRNQVRKSSEESPESYNAFCKSETSVYANGYFHGDEIAKLSLNDEIEVIDEFNDCAYIKSGNVTGYIHASQISKSKIDTAPVVTRPSTNAGQGTTQTPVDNDDYDNTPSWGDTTGGNSGGDTGTGDTGGDTGGNGPETEESQDGGEIELSFRFPIESIFTIAYAVEGEESVVLSDDTAIYLGMLVKDEELMITEMNEDTATVYVNKRYGVIPKWAVSLENEKAYEVWEGYSHADAGFYGSIVLEKGYVTLEKNTRVQVLYEIEEKGVYLVLVDGEEGFIKISNVEHEEIPEPVVQTRPAVQQPQTPQVQTPVYDDDDDDSYYGGDTGGTETGGDTGGDDTGGDAEWTEPVL